ncbi:MAG: hypothetical protein JOZ98_19820 [Solirubrobacterales bacterium]|nr:hypothetical protein [Solirubrobacterales bacterium]MBV9425166.1 hypothetical protein [Solirubrobacterales bacterium]MBV9800277.1 hypothetical protein [Solirubrobacterales bacterium]
MIRGERAVEMHDLSVDGIADGWVLAGGLLDQLATDAFGWLLDTDIAVAQERLVHRSHTTRGEPVTLPVLLREWEGEAVWASGRFAGAAGAGMRLIVPTDAEDWNRRLAVLTSGSGVYRDLAAAYLDERARRDGALIELDRDTGFAPGLGANLYAELLLDRGYAVAWLRKDEVRPPEGVNSVCSDDGRSWRVSHHSNVAYTLGLIELAQSQIKELLGQLPAHSYLYGHSSGAMTARLVNLRPESNTSATGETIVDGIIGDDTGAGLYLPSALDADGEETVLVSEQSRGRFVPQIDVSRALYQPQAYLPLKRYFGEVIAERGLAGRYRHYEIAGVSHFDAGMAGRPDILDLGGLFGALWDALDQWCSEGRNPPESRQGDRAVRLPEVAAPLGEWVAPNGGPFTVFRPFDGQPNLEDDRRARPTEAWQELALLERGLTVDAATYAGALAAAAAELRRGRLYSAEAELWINANSKRLLAESGVQP